MDSFLNKRHLFKSISAILFLALAAGCSSSHIKEYKAVYWPYPPDPPRYVYEGTLRTAEDVVAFSSKASFKTAITGAVPRNAMSFKKPYDIAARGGRIVISDTISHKATIWDIPRKRVFVFGKRGEGVIKKPGGVGMDGRQWIYVVDVGENVVYAYDSLGLFMHKVGGPEDYQRPVDVAANEAGDRVYVVDAGGIDSMQHQVVVFDGEGKKISVIGSRGREPGQFNLPIQAAVAADGTLYVLDAGNFRVQAFDEEGNFLRQWGKVGRNFGDLARPRGIAVDRAGNVYVTDSAYRNFQIFNPEGQLLMAIGGGGFEDKPGQFSLPAGIAVDDGDYVYIVDQIFAKVEIIRKLTERETAHGGVLPALSRNSAQESTDRSNQDLGDTARKKQQTEMQSVESESGVQTGSEPVMQTSETGSELKPSGIQAQEKILLPE